MRKMEPLNRHLNGLGANQWRATFQMIEEIIGTDLPGSARAYPAWWANDATPGRQSWAWLDADFHTAELNLSRDQITFVRRNQPSCPARPQGFNRRNDSNSSNGWTGQTAPAKSISHRHLQQIGTYDVALVSCVKSKRREAVAAKNLYVSSRFKNSRVISEACAKRWFILSALHGLLDPDEVIAPYEYTLKKAKAAERCEWAQKVFQTFCASVAADATILVLAGRDYSGNLVPLLTRRGHYVSQPLEGLNQGRGLSLLLKMADSCR